MGGDLAALGAFGRAQHGGDEAPRAVEHHDGLEAVFVVMGVEQPQLLSAMDGVEGVVDVERDPLRDLREGGAVEPDHGVTHAQQHTVVGQVLHPADGRLRTQVARARQPLQRHLEHRVGAERIGVDAVLVARRDHQHAEAQDVGDAVLGAGWIARVLDAGREPAGDIEPPLYLAQSQQPGVRGQGAAVEAGGSGPCRFTGDSPGRGSVVSVMAGVAFPERARIGVDNQILREIS